MATPNVVVSIAAICVAFAMIAPELAVDEGLLQAALAAPYAEVFECQLLYTPPVGRDGLLRPKLLQLGQGRRLSRRESTSLLQTLRGLSSKQPGHEHPFDPRVLVRFYAKPSAIDLVIDPSGQLSFELANAGTPQGRIHAHKADRRMAALLKLARP
jgi:hypothetical protein